MFEVGVFLVLSVCIIFNIILKTNTEFCDIKDVISSGKKHINAKMIIH